VATHPEIEVEDLAPGGEGVGRHDGRPVFVPFTAPGDRVEVEIPPGDGAAHARWIRLVRGGPERVVAPCPHFGPGDGPGPDRACGGCEWLHLGYELQLRQKERSLAATLRRIGRLEPEACGLRPILPSPRPLRYRSRAKFHHHPASGRLVFYRRRSHEPVRLEGCHLLEPGLDGLRGRVGPALVEARLAPREVVLEWSELQGRGAALLRGLRGGDEARRRATELLRLVPDLCGVLLEPDPEARGAPPPVAVGDPVLRQARDPGDPSRGVARSRPDVFQQANRGANARLVAAALGLLRPDGEEVLELHCGAGNFTGPLALRARSVAAVEAQGPALELARTDLGGGNVRFFSGDALALAGALAREGRRFGAVLLDPPREGMKGVGPLLRSLAVPRAVYVSCDPATLARDLRAAVAAGYRVVEVQPVDMFPQTHHVEAVALLVPA